MLNEVPETVAERSGIDPMKLDLAFSLLTDAVEQKLTPSVAALVGRRGQIVGQYAAGHYAMADSQRYETSMQTLYDCASLTKVVVTLPLVLKLIENQSITLSDCVADFLPEFRNGKKASVTIHHLLTHTSGLPPSVEKTFLGWESEEIKNFLFSQALADEPGKQVIYSDLGFIALGEIVSKVLGQPLDEAADHYLFRPLGMTDSKFCPSKTLRERTAATEFRSDIGYRLWGEVHDERAFALGGVCGHAGLFSTAVDLGVYAAMWLEEGSRDEHRILSPELIRSSVRNHTKSLNGNRGYGWVLKGDGYDVSGNRFSSRSFGHTGYTGTSLWMDPDTGLYVILLTNRVYFGRRQPLAKLRKAFHDAVAASMFRL
ncbi:MAG TPA: serine hydrolase domain-containing protein [Bacillales bacterium]|nr:serine hydrolase domain-containing protein [Bacillales bacterium]